MNKSLFILHLKHVAFIYFLCATGNQPTFVKNKMEIVKYSYSWPHISLFYLWNILSGLLLLLQHFRPKVVVLYHQNNITKQYQCLNPSYLFLPFPSRYKVYKKSKNGAKVTSLGRKHFNYRFNGKNISKIGSTQPFAYPNKYFTGSRCKYVQ